MRLLLVNQFAPPDPAPTARLLGDLAEELASRGHEAVPLGDASDYRGAKTLLGSRALREGLALLRLAWRIARAAGPFDAILCLSSPPMLPAAVRLARWRHPRARLCHWAMDLYPDVALALGEVRPRSALHRASESLMASFYRACDLIVALDSDMAARIGRRGVDALVAAPWPPAFTMKTPPADAADGGPSERTDGASPFVWLYSGNLGRAHEWRTLLEAQLLLERSGASVELLFQGGGTEREAAQKEAEALGLRRCRWSPYAPDEDLLPSLLAADCFVATQRPETKGCLWPSKLALARLLGRPMVWVGPTEGSVADLLRSDGHACFRPGDSAELAATLRSLAARPAPRSPDEAAAARNRIDLARKDGASRLADAIEACLALPSRSARSANA